MRRSVNTGGEDGARRRERILTAAVSGSLAAIVAIPVYAIAGSGGGWWAAAGGAILAASAAYFAHVFQRARRDRARLRRLERTSDRIMSLCDSLPRRSDVETLAVLHEIRICYGEALKLAEGLGDKGRQLAATISRALARIDQMYDLQSGLLRRTETNAAEFAAAMRKLGRNADGTTLR